MKVRGGRGKKERSGPSCPVIDQNYLLGNWLLMKVSNTSIEKQSILKISIPFVIGWFFTIYTTNDNENDDDVKHNFYYL